MPQPHNITSPKLVKIDFDIFKIHNPNSRAAFENLSYFLFCRRFAITNGLFRYKNQIGVEAEPLKYGHNIIGFQSKFFESLIDKDQLISSLRKAKERHPRLSILVYYINKEFSEGREKANINYQKKKVVEDEAKTMQIKIEWVVPSNFELLLNQPSNLDLAQLFFGSADHFGFIKNSFNHKVQTFLQSKEFITLPVSDESKLLTSPQTYILKTNRKSFLITGHPGSGKSFFIHFLFREFGGLNEQTTYEMIKLLINNQAIPMVINLKECISESLDDLIRVRQNESNVRGQHLGFIYLFDGLDELSEEQADLILSYLCQLEQQNETKKIIISCRSGNLNRLKVSVYLPQVVHLQFGNLNIEYIHQFFTLKNDKNKIKLLQTLLKSNKKIINEVKDILLIKLLWETIERIGPTSSVADLIQKKIEILLNSPDHKKSVDSLNLLDAKSNELMQLNQEISFTFQQRFQYRFTRKDLQEIILKKFPRLDYKSINELLNYQSNLFFENSYQDNNDLGFIYQHRRYQEFFFAQRLKSEYEKNPVSLRELDVLANREFLEGYFFPYLRKEYEKAQNLIGLMDLNLMDVYLGNHTGFGVEDAYYLNSSEFIRALASQNPYFVEELLESDNFQIKNIIFIDIENLKEVFELWLKDKNNYRITNKLSSIYSNDISLLLDCIVAFWNHKRKDIAKKLLTNLDQVVAIYKDNNFIEQLIESQRPANPFWKEWDESLFIEIQIRRKKSQDVLTNRIRGNYSNIGADVNTHGRNENKEKLIKGFFKVILTDLSSFGISNLTLLDEYEFTVFLDLLTSLDFLTIFVRNKKLQSIIKSIILSKGILVSRENYFVAFYKTFLNIELNQNEVLELNKLETELRDKRKIDWSLMGWQMQFAIISFSLNKNDFEQINEKLINRYNFYDELQLYSALFRSFILILDDKKTVPQALRNYIEYLDSHDKHLGLYLKHEISALWAYIFSASNNQEIDTLILLKRRLLQEGTNVLPNNFYYRLAFINKELFDSVVLEIDLTNFENSLSNSEDYQTLVDNCFLLSIYYSNKNDEKSRQLFIKGLKEGVLRHGWRKDTLVSYQLVDGLEILWKNNWETNQQLVNLTNEVFNLTLKAASFTDGKGTWQGPYNVVELISKYNLELAESLKKRLIELRGQNNFNNQLITSILLGKIRLGVSIAEIEEGMAEFRIDYKRDDSTSSDVYEQKIIVLVTIAESEFYRENERESAFNKAYELVEEMKTGYVSYYLQDSYFKELKVRYLTLCRKYGKFANVEIGRKESLEKKPSVSEEKFIKDLKKINTKKEIINLYKQIEDYKSGIVLSRKDTWQALLNQTFIVLNNISPFIKLIEKSSYPHTDFYTINSKYFHFGLAIALSDIKMKSEALNYLYVGTGHGGFCNMMKVYEVIKDKRMCNLLFSRYLQLCHFLCE